MSTAAERIREARERDEASAETEPEPTEPTEPTEPSEPSEPTEPEPQPTEPPTTPSGPQASGGPDAEQAFELEKATTAYYKRVAKVFGGELPPECPQCNGLGFDLFGSAGQPAFRLHDQYKGCDDCDGLGKVKTGSQVMGHDLTDCPKCQGRGYLERLPVPTAVPDQPAEYGTPAWMGTVPPQLGP